MQDLAGIIDPILHVGWRLGKVPYLLILGFRKEIESARNDRKQASRVIPAIEDGF